MLSGTFSLTEAKQLHSGKVDYAGGIPGFHTSTIRTSFLALHILEELAEWLIPRYLVKASFTHHYYFIYTSMAANANDVHMT